jgi:hypothetical protein
MLWIDLGFALIAAIAFLRGLIQGDSDFIAKSFLAIVVWLFFAWFCYLQVKRLQRKADAMLEELRHLGYEEALTKARATSIPLSSGLVAEKVGAQRSEWHAFEKESVQYVVVKAEHGTRAEVRQI